MFTVDQWDALTPGDRLIRSASLGYLDEYWILIRQDGETWYAIDAVDGLGGTLDITDDLRIIERNTVLNIEFGRY